jgi:hypothetical protein
MTHNDVHATMMRAMTLFNACRTMIALMHNIDANDIAMCVDDYHDRDDDDMIFASCAYAYDDRVLYEIAFMRDNVYSHYFVMRCVDEFVARV